MYSWSDSSQQTKRKQHSHCSKIKSELFRIGSPVFANESKLNKLQGHDALFSRNHEFVYLPDFDPWQRVNGTWREALGHLLNDN